MGLELTKLFEEPGQQVRGTRLGYSVHRGRCRCTVGIDRWTLHRRVGVSDDVREFAKAVDAWLGGKNSHCGS